MTKEQWESLKQGDIVENDLTKSRYCIVDNYSTEPITQLAKETIRETYLRYSIVMLTVKNKEE